MRDYSYRINEIKLAIGEPMELLPERIEKKLRLKKGTVKTWEVARESIDARNKAEIRLTYTVDFTTDKELRLGQKEENKFKIRPYRREPRAELIPGSEVLKGRPVVVGLGPCGLFAALELAKNGYRPIVLERGWDMSRRVKDVERFRQEAVLDPNSNMLFGEGGAGTFSDGKLTSGIKDARIRYVLETFRDAGAGQDIMYLHRPHIGTDVLRAVIVRLRKQVVELGGEVRFGTQMTELGIGQDGLEAVTVRSEEKGEERIETNALILATGHSARDTFRMVRDKGLTMEQKPFSIGVRMEHPQEIIDRAQYGDEKRLPPADYKINYHASNGRGVYSFCMCPGGEVVVCSTEEGQLCVNGMSNRKRDSGTANSGILCDVRTSDFGSDDVLAGIDFQIKYEKLAFENGGGNFQPPTCTMKEFLAGPDASADSAAVIASMPDYASEAIREAVPHFARKIRGYDMDDAIIKAVETRSSSPVRILRDKESGESNVRGIYPAGEGCGYAGGITSAACDGLRQAETIIARFARPE